MITGCQWSMHNVPWNPDHYKNISWNTGLAAERARHDLKLKKALKDGAYKRWKKLLKQKASSPKLQAP